MHLKSYVSYFRAFWILALACVSCAAAATQVTRFVVTETGGDNAVGTTPITAGGVLKLRLRAVDSSGATVTDYAQNVTLALAEPRVTNSRWASVSVASSAFVSGVADNVAINVRHAGTADRRITVTDGNIATYDAAGAFTVRPAGFQVTLSGSSAQLGASTIIQGQGAVLVRVRAVNADSTTAETYEGDVTLSSNASPDTFTPKTATISNSGGVADGISLFMTTLVSSDSIAVTDGQITTVNASGAFAVVAPGSGNSLAASRLKIANVVAVNTPYPSGAVSIRFDAINPKSGQKATDKEPAIPPTVVTGPMDFLIEVFSTSGELAASAVVQRAADVGGSVDEDTVATIQGSVVLPASLAPGNYRVDVTAGLSGNVGSGTITVAGGPDLAITRFDYAPGEYRGGDAMRFDMVWQNLPASPAPNSKVGDSVIYRAEIHLSANTTFGDTDDILVWQGTFAGNDYGRELLAGQSVAFSDEFLMPKNLPGTYYLLAKVNSAGGRDNNFSTGFTEIIGPAPGDVWYDGNNVVLARESAKITLLPIQGAETTRVSLTDDDQQSTGLSDRPVVSKDGRYVVFQSYGALAGATAANTTNIFMRDTLLDITTLVSPGTFNGGANGHSLYPRITDDVRYVVFQSDASNLLPGDTNGYTDIFIRDVAKGTTIRLLGAGNVQPNQSSFLPDISADGRFIVFESTAKNFVPGVALGGIKQIYLYDRDKAGTGTFDILGNTGYTLISKTAAGVAANAACSTPRVSRDGEHVVFTTRASNLVSSSTSFTQVVRWSRSTGALVTVSANTGGTLANGDAGFAAINRDGSYVVYASRAKNLTADSYAVGVPHLFRARLANGAVAAVTRINGPGGVEPNNPYGWTFAPDLGSFEPAISDDGNVIAFVSESTNLLPSISVHHIDRTDYASAAVQNYEDRTLASDVYVADLTDPNSPSNFRASVSRFGYESTTWDPSGLLTSQVVSHRSPAMSGDAGYIVFSSDAKGHNGLVFGATNFDYLATNAVKDIYLFNAKTGLPTTPTDLPVVSLVLPDKDIEIFESQKVTLAGEILNATRSVAQVEFYADGNLIGIATSPTTAGGRRYEFSWDISTLGLLITRSYALSVVAVDSGGLRSAVVGSVVATVKINTPPAVAITSPVSGGFVSTGEEFTIYASATDADGTVARVEFFANGTSIGSTQAPPYKVVWTPGIAGDYILTANASDNLGAVSWTSAPVNVFAAFEVRLSPLMDSSAFINGAYADLLDRTPTTQEFDTAIARFDAGEELLTRAQYLVEMEGMPEFKTRLQQLTAYKIVMGVWPTRDELQAAIDAAVGTGGGGGGSGDDHGDTTSTATTVNSSVTSGRIETWGDIDFFRVNVTIAGTFTFSSSGSSDTVGALYDSAGNIIAENDDAGSGWNFLLTRSLTAGTYYLSVEGWMGWATGSYRLNVSGPGFSNNSGPVDGADVALTTFINNLFSSSAYLAKYGPLPSLNTAANRTALFTQFFINNYGTQPTDQQKLEGATNLTSLGGAATYVSYMVTGAKISSRDLIYNAPDVSTQHLSAALIAGLQRIRPIAADVQLLAAMSTQQAAQAVIDDTDYVNRYITVNAPPQSQTVPLGGTLRLSVGALGSQPFTYQWYRGGSPLAGAVSQFLTINNVTGGNAGVYSVEIAGPNGSVFSQPAFVTVGTNTTRVVNLSTRAPAGSGDQTMIAGFVVSGSEPRQMLIRAAGPALVNYGLTGALADPQLRLFQGNTPIAENNNWSDDPRQADEIAAVASRVGAFTLADGGKDAALLVTLQPGLYTAQVTGADGGAGIGLVEVYDAGTSLATRAVNVSTRAVVKNGGHEIVIAGFALNGTSPRKVLVRAVGPALASYGVSGVLANPRLTIHRQSDGVILYGNDDWANGSDAAGIAAAAAQVGAFELTAGSKDAAMVVTLAPGLYTVQAAGVDGGTGIVLVEVYDLEN